jgi:predicted DNA-binding protein with PD1-like motif
MKTYAIEKARHFVLRAGSGDVIPDDLTRVLSEQAVTCGWLRASGVLLEVELRVFDGALGSLAETRRIAGPVQALSIEGSLGLERGEPSVGLRAVLARETDRGMEVLAGEIVSARVVALEAFVTAFEDLSIGRAIDANASVMLFGDPSDARYRPDAGEPEHTPAPVAKQAPSAWTEVIAASAEGAADARRPAVRAGSLGGAIPQRPAGRQTSGADDGAQMPEAGDAVEHFAFGRADVLKSDGDRLHLKVDKDGRIREIALEMLKVTPLESNGPHRRFKLDRKL